MLATRADTSFQIHFAPRAALDPSVKKGSTGIRHLSEGCRSPASHPPVPSTLHLTRAARGQAGIRGTVQVFGGQKSKSLGLGLEWFPGN